MQYMSPFASADACLLFHFGVKQSHSFHFMTTSSSQSQVMKIDSSSSILVEKANLLYPTPTPSPINSTFPSRPGSPGRTTNLLSNCTTREVTTNDQTNVNATQLLELTSDLSGQTTSKKRKSSPVKKLENFSSIIQLDVYNVYLLDPKSLVFNKKFRRSVASIMNTEPIVPEETLMPTEKRQLAAMPIATDFDMTPYLNTIGAPSVLWKKGSCLNIPMDAPGYDQLTEEELRTCSTLRILPDQYLHIKQTILSAAETRGPFKKRDAKSWFRIDVNKTAVLFDWFRSLGWIPSDEEWERRLRVKTCP